jgi:drug/metabolite transporter (DMT)-like permease
MRRIGVTLIIAQQALFTIETAAVHQLAGALDVLQLSLLRASGGLGLVVCIAARVGWSVWHTEQLWLQFIRALVTIGYLLVLMYSFTAMPFADATAIGYTQAIYITLLAPAILGENVGRHRWFGVLLGMVGALLLIQPDFSHVSWIYLGVLLGTSLNALALVLTRYMQRKDDAATVMLYLSVFSVALLAPMTGTATWRPSCPHLWALGVLVLGPLGQYCGIVAVRHVEAATLAPYTYVRLIFAGVVGLVAFGERLHWTTALGATIIVTACLLAALPMREKTVQRL